jgi:DNA helicase-2/ATP-dependent DNA helicase PcrA
LEYERVYLLDVFDGVLPFKCEKERKNEDDLRHYEEDRRIYYVAMTRAKDELYLFSSEGMASEFTNEMMRYIPNERVDEEDVFAPLKVSLMRKRYTDGQKGKGVVSAQCGEKLLVAYENGETELLTLEEMMRRRDRAAVYEPVAASRVMLKVGEERESMAIERFIPGRRVRHSKFGAGVILGVKCDKVEVRFENHGMKALMLETVVQNHLIEFV